MNYSDKNLFANQEMADGQSVSVFVVVRTEFTPPAGMTKECSG